MRLAGEIAAILEEVEQQRKTNAEKMIEIDKAFNKLGEIESAYFTNAAEIQALDATQFADTSQYEEELRKLRIREESLIMQMFFVWVQIM